METKDKLNQFYSNKDPWSYDANPYDALRREILLKEIPSRKYESVLDIGCGNGFVTTSLPGNKVVGIDISANAVEAARARALGQAHLQFFAASIFDLALNSPAVLECRFDLIVITGVMYDQYIGESLSLIYHIINEKLADNGILVTVHIDDWYKARFPFFLVKSLRYKYREFEHRLEVYVK